MFWDKWIPKKYFIKPEICAVEVCFTEEGTTYYYSHLKNKNNKLELFLTGSCKDTLVLPETILKNKIPTLIIVNGKGIILKKITLSENSDQNFEEIIRQNLPAIHIDDFYAQLYKQNDHSAFIVLCRKEQLDRIISEFKNKKYDLAGILTGTPSIIGLQPLWSNFNSLRTSVHRVELTNGNLDSIAPITSEGLESIKIDDLHFNTDYTLGFAGGLSYLMQRNIAENNSGNLNLLQEQHIEKNKLRFLMLSIVGLAFILAIVNVIFYTSYFDKNNKLETELSVYQGKYEQINELLNDYQKNKNLIENAGILNRNKLSEYADRIGKTLPDEVVLSDLYFNPKKDKDENADSLITFENKSLVLKGNCPKSFIVNEWISVLKMQKFIKDVSLEKFVYNNQGMLPNFEIKLITE
jgi:Tfp pilus assembly protein PilN